MKGKNQRIIDEFGDLSFLQLRGLVLIQLHGLALLDYEGYKSFKNRDEQHYKPKPHQ